MNTTGFSYQQSLSQSNILASSSSEHHKSPATKNTKQQQAAEKHYNFLKNQRNLKLLASSSTHPNSSVTN